MPNGPAKGMVTTSFVLPKALDEAVGKQAKIEMGNKSDIIRRACINYLPEHVRQLVLREIANGYEPLSPPEPLANPPPGNPEVEVNFKKKGKK
jgi:hypothetical protein